MQYLIRQEKKNPANSPQKFIYLFLIIIKIKQQQAIWKKKTSYAKA
jgi:hypothetical protein